MAPDLYVRSWGRADAPAVLYLHGGPGQSSYEFEQHQVPRLAERLRVICLDQRGVLRSGPLAPGAPLTLDDLVADCETVRSGLGIDRWAVLGQSFGGLLALRYAVAHPDAVRAVVFENPSWDLDRTCRSLISAFLAHPTAAAHPGVVAEAAPVLAGEPDARTLTALMIRVVVGFGDDAGQIYSPDPEARARIEAVLAAAPFGPADWAKSEDHLARLAEDPALYERHTPLLAALTRPALLIKGGLDPIPSAGEVQDFRDTLPDAEVRVFDDCGHFVHAEKPAEYADLVAAFLTP